MRRKKLDECVIGFPFHGDCLQTNRIVRGINNFYCVLFGICFHVHADFHLISVSSFIRDRKIGALIRYA